MKLVYSDMVTGQNAANMSRWATEVLDGQVVAMEVVVEVVGLDEGHHER